MASQSCTAERTQRLRSWGVRTPPELLTHPCTRSEEIRDLFTIEHLQKGQFCLRDKSFWHKTSRRGADRTAGATPSWGVPTWFCVYCGQFKFSRTLLSLFFVLFHHFGRLIYSNFANPRSILGQDWWRRPPLHRESSAAAADLHKCEKFFSNFISTFLIWRTSRIN